jgi:hypothetical protein
VLASRALHAAEADIHPKCDDALIYISDDYLLGQTGTAERSASALITARRPADMAVSPFSGYVIDAAPE